MTEAAVDEMLGMEVGMKVNTHALIFCTKLLGNYFLQIGVAWVFYEHGYRAKSQFYMFYYFCMICIYIFQ